MPVKDWLRPTMRRAESLCDEADALLAIARIKWRDGDQGALQRLSSIGEALSPQPEPTPFERAMSEFQRAKWGG